MRGRQFDLWRITEPILLGCIANIVINFVFKPERPDFILEEFVTAIAFAVLVTEINRIIDRRLEVRVKWTTSAGKRFLYQLGFLTLSLIVILNGIGNLYIWIIGDDFYSLEELLTINLSVFVVALLLTLMKWAMHFYRNWKTAEVELDQSKAFLGQLKEEMAKEGQQLKLQKGNEVLRIRITEVTLAETKLGVLWVHYGETKAVFPGTLDHLMEQLPKTLYFKATRNIILHKESIASIASSSYGKIDVFLRHPSYQEQITVSRLKAAAFRKWYHSSSVLN